MRASRITAAAALTLLLAAAPGPVQDDTWSFSGVDRIELSGISGDLVVEAASGDAVELGLEADVRPADAFAPEVRQDGGTVRIEESWRGRNSSGHVRWTLSIPSTMPPTIVMRSASGGLDLSGVDATVRFESASGDVRVRSASIRTGSTFETASGDYDVADADVGQDVTMETASGDLRIADTRAAGSFGFETASGDVVLQDTRGILRASSASGDVEVRDAELDGPSRFSSASGDVRLHLSQAPRFDLEASSASGDVDVEMPFGSDFTLVMTRRQDRGRIDAPFDGAAERTFERHGQRYVEQRVEQGSGGPEIVLSTASGSVSVRRAS